MQSMQKSNQISAPKKITAMDSTNLSAASLVDATDVHGIYDIS